MVGYWGGPRWESEMRLFKKWLKDGHCLEAESGWMDPDGVLYRCGASHHARFAEYIRTSKSGYQINRNPPPDDALFRAGWIKLPDKSSGFSLTLAHTAVTQSQYDSIFDWYKWHNMDLPVEYRSALVKG